MDSVRLCCAPGSTTPTDGLTVSHGEPEVAVNEIGAPLVDNVTVWSGTGTGGAVRLNAVGLTVSVEGGAVTVRFTGIDTGVATPDTVTTTVTGGLL